MNTTLIGTSGWMYDDWRGRLYPPELAKTGWLEHYAEEFPAVEVNATFYRLASRDAVRRWRAAVSPTFVFAVKGSRFITHTLKLTGADTALERFFAPLDALGDQLAVVLWQLPPWMPADPTRLADFLDVAIASGPRHVRHAVEFRHETWYHDDVLAALDAHDALVVTVSGGKAPPAPEPFASAITGGQAYVRFHGIGGPARRYGSTGLEPWAQRLAEQPGFVFFNNDVGGAAVDDARWLRSRLTSHAAAAIAGRDE